MEVNSGGICANSPKYPHYSRGSYGHGGSGGCSSGNGNNFNDGGDRGGDRNNTNDDHLNSDTSTSIHVVPTSVWKYVHRSNKD